jgi:hypothetical protein
MAVAETRSRHHSENALYRFDGLLGVSRELGTCCVRINPNQASDGSADCLPVGGNVGECRVARIGPLHR